jgi:hypothetical protein
MPYKAHATPGQHRKTFKDYIIIVNSEMSQVNNNFILINIVITTLIISINVCYYLKYTWL